MRIAYLDCFSGISGDMFLGALLDVGVSAQLLEETIAALNIGARMEVSRVDRTGISALKVDVYSHGEKDLPREEYWKQRSQSQREPHSHGSTGHSHDHRQAPIELLEHNYAAPPPTTAPRHNGQHDHQHGRNLSEIRAIILGSSIAEPAKAKAIAIFEALGVAEAKIHHTSMETVHFHEVGAVDAMVDIVCAAVGAHALGVDEIICSALNVGGGTVNCAHGTFPVPAPATLELLRDIPIYSSGIQAELVTPTGAAIVTTLAHRFGSFPSIEVQKIGYGAGTREFPEYPNVARLTIGESAEVHSENLTTENVSVLEANLDDLSPQVFAFVIERLLEAGALDAFGLPVHMKKGRLGMLLTVLCRPKDAARLEQIIFAETTTLGVRQRQQLRQILSRKWVAVSTQWGDVRMKIASMNGTVTSYAPEYEDCRRIASERRVPLKNVMQEAMQKYLADNPKK